MQQQIFACHSDPLAKEGVKVHTPSPIIYSPPTQVNFTPGANTACIGGKVLELVQYHFHAPSEHTIEGTKTPMEVHLVGGWDRDRVRVSLWLTGITAHTWASVLYQLGLVDVPPRPGKKGFSSCTAQKLVSLRFTMSGQDSERSSPQSAPGKPVCSSRDLAGLLPLLLHHMCIPS